MTAMTIRPSLLDDDIAAAFEREKSLFMARNTERCGHLLVRFGLDEADIGFAISAAFTLDEARNWQQIEVTVPLAELRREGGPDHGLISAFGELDEGISAARIARLFAPLSVAQRMAGGRRD
ncbi:hypothetical protein [Devosia sp.]|uniref:hypothetical protein n=1 Tax=Devosia sp. TaxID=1871048 RepID=UPI00095A59B2|nr:hypothetical protein [Devosia sp.]MBN9361244.1 hypothetical protein [Devosia sp.]OJX26337.1 MAG: hypothetical protein BGO83_20760 [Devosia sp. 66-14]